MTVALPYRFMLTAILFGLVGMIFGIRMGITEDFTLAPMHAHINLVGWASMFLFVLWYQAVPVAARTMLAAVHYWVALAGALLLAIGICGTLAPRPPLDVVIVPGSLLTVISMLIFLWTVWQASRRAA